ncbi:Piwi domain-containing protein [Obelidium mucronatum]|nr:Piwi domain-containing protein [Obelidium mucronatum]
MSSSSSSSRGRGGGAGRGSGRSGAPPSSAPAFELDFNIVEQALVRPKRPAVGTRGKKVRMFANSFSLSIPDKNCYHYDVDIRPETLPPVNRRIFESWKAAQGSLPAKIAVYDGRKNLYAPDKIPMSEEGEEIQIILKEGASDREQKFTMKVRQVAVINMERVHRFIANDTKDSEVPRDALTILDLLLAARPNTLFTAVNKKTGSSFYKAYEPRFNISGGLNLRQGWKQSVKYTYKELLLNLDVACTAFYRSGPLVDLVAGFFNKTRVQDVNPRQVTGGTIEFQRLSKFLSNVNVEITYRDSGRLKYKIRGLSKQTPDKAIISRDDGTKLSVSDYFSKEFNLKIQCPFLPLVMCGNEGQVLIPMEFLRVKEGQRHLGKLSDVQTADVIKIAAVAPPERQARIMEGRNLLHEGEADPLMKAWGVTMKSQMKQVEGRLLQGPVVTGSLNVTPQNGAYDLSKQGACKFFRPARLEFWAVAVFGDTRNMPFDAMSDFVTQLFKECTNRGMQISQRPLKEMIVPQRRGTIEETLIEANKRALEFGAKALPAGTALPAVAQLIICVFDKGGTTYDEIKFFAETKLSLMTQCIQSRHLPPRGPKPGVCTNLALKLNAKVGGVNMIVDPVKQLNILGKPIPTMIMGADVTHPPAGAQGGVSIASVVASMDSKFAEYRAAIKVQGPREEIITDLNVMTREHLLQFQQRAKGRLPDRVIFFRDGVSEGQFGEVALQEVQNLKKAFRDIGHQIKLTFLVVNKRHSHRFFCQDQREGDRKGNVMAGTVIDSGITHPFEFDFFLNSHQGLQGTSRAAHYHVLYDENNFTPDDLQEVCYRMCYLFARASRSVSIVPAVYYAHLMAYRARCYRPGGVGGSSEMAGSSGSGGIDSAGIDEFHNVTNEMKRTMFFT